MKIQRRQDFVDLSSKTIKLLMAAVPCLMIMTGLALYARLAWSKNLKIMISALPSSYWLKLNIEIWGKKSLRSRLHLIGTVSAVLFFPIKNLHIRNHKLNQRDIDNFPKALKRQLLTCNYLLYFGAAWFGLTYHLYN